MRYTTIIDISEFPALYNNINVRLVYLHLSLRSGYHDADRDLINTSIRRLAREVGITESAARNALAQLRKLGMIAPQGNLISVKKWIPNGTITPRPKTDKQAKAREAAIKRDDERLQREAERRREQQERDQLAAQGKNSYMLYYEDLQRKAAAGDPEAAAAVLRNKAMYERMCAAAQQELNNLKLRSS